MKKGDGKTYKAYRFRLYPSAEQETLMARTFGCCRFLYNRMLADKKEEYQKTGKMLRNTPAQYKKEYEWLKEVDSLALANTQLHLEAAYRNFFRDPRVGFPKFRAKHHSRDSYTTNVVNGNIVLNGRRLRLPKMGSVRIIVHREVPPEGRLKSVTITREPSGKYYASLLYEMPVCENQTDRVLRADRVLGVDFAMADLAVFSDGMRAMSRALHFGKSTSDNANGQFRTLLEGKLTAEGKAFVRIDRFYPSSRRCSRCGKIKKELPLSERTYVCECGLTEDRDINAAINIREEGKRILGLVG